MHNGLNEKKCVLQVTGVKILSIVGTYYFFHYYFFSAEMPFKVHKFIYFLENLKKNNLGFTIKGLP